MADDQALLSAVRSMLPNVCRVMLTRCSCSAICVTPRRALARGVVNTRAPDRRSGSIWKQCRREDWQQTLLPQGLVLILPRWDRSHRPHWHTDQKLHDEISDKYCHSPSTVIIVINRQALPLREFGSEPLLPSFFREPLPSHLAVNIPDQRFGRPRFDLTTGCRGVAIGRKVRSELCCVRISVT